MKGLRLVFAVLAGLAFIALFPQAVFGQKDGDTRQIYVYLPTQVVGLDGPAGNPNTYEYLTVMTFTVRPGVPGSFYAWHFDSSGKKMQLRISGVNGSSFEATESGGSIVPGGSITLTYSYCQDNQFGGCPNTNIRSGWTRFQVGQTFSVASGWQYDTLISVVFQRRDNLGFPKIVADAPVVELDTSFIIPASVTTGGIDSGIAIVNPSDQLANLSFQIFNDVGQLKGSKQLTLNAAYQLSEFVSQLFPNLPLDGLGNMLTSGQLRISSDTPIAVLSLKSYTAPGFFNMGGGAAFVVK